MSMVGKSCQNQRIERMWVDIWNNVRNVCPDIFVLMEDMSILDITEPKHMWALHYVFIARLNIAFKKFTMQWNHHRLSTES